MTHAPGAQSIKLESGGAKHAAALVVQVRAAENGPSGTQIAISGAVRKVQKTHYGLSGGMKPPLDFK